MQRSKALTNQQIVRAAAVVLVGFFASGVLGLVRTSIISATFGAGNALDAFLAAQRIPEVIFVLVAGGALGSSFIPVFNQFLEANNVDGAWRLASAVMTVSALAAALLGLLVIIFAPFIVQTFLVPDKPAEVQALTVSLTRLMMVTPFIFAISGLLMGILHAHQLFMLPSIAISMNSIGLIIGAVVIARMLPPEGGVGQVGAANVYGLAYGAVLSALLHLLVQLPGLRQVRARLRLLPNLRVSGVKQVLLLMGPRVLGLAVVQINFVVNAAFTSGMLPGSYTALTVAWSLMFFALGVIGQSVGSAVFPSLAALAAQDDMDGFKQRLSGALRGVLFLSLPATIGMILLGEPVIAVLFQRLEWTAENTVATAWALSFFAIGIAGHSLLEVLSRAFYALSDTKTPVIIGIVSMVSNIILSIILIRVLGDAQQLARGPFAGLALANSLTTLLEGMALWWLMRRRIGSQGEIRGINDGEVFSMMWRTLLAALGMGGVIMIVGRLLAESAQWVIVLASIAAGGAGFFVLAFALGLNEPRDIFALVLRRFRRN